MSEKEKYLQIRREAMWTGFALVILILFWLVAGFGMSHIDVKVFGLPVWAVTGTVGVWIFAMVLVKMLPSLVFQDIDLEPDEEFFAQIREEDKDELVSLKNEEGAGK